MPPKDDEDPKTTKDVVSKKHKQMLNREELDLSLVAEAFGGIIAEAEVVQPSLPGTGKRTIKKQQSSSQEDPREKLKRLLKTSRIDKYQTNEPVSGKQVQQFDIDIAGKAAEEKSGAGGKPGAGQTKSLKGQTLTGGKFKGATPIGKREASILRKYAQASGGVGQNPLRAEPGSGAELTAGRKRALKASARRAVEKKEQIARQARGKEVRKAGSELLSQMQKQSKGRKALEKRMGKAVDKFAKQEGPKVLKQIQGETPPKTPKGQLSFPGMGKSFGRGAERRASAAQDAAIDIAKQQRKEAGFKDLAKAIKGTRPVSGAARDPWKQFPKKPQKQYGLPKPEPKAGPSTKALPPAKEVKGALPPKATKSKGGALAPSTKPGALVAPDKVTKVKVDMNVPGGRPNRIPRILGLTAGVGRSLYKKDIAGVVTQGLALGQELGRVSREMEISKKELEALKPIKKGTTISTMDPITGKVKQLTQAEFEAEKQRKAGRTAVGTRQGAAPRLQRQPSPQLTPTIPPTLRGTGKPGSRPDGKRRRGLPGLGLPDQPGGKIGRRQNPQ